MNLEKHFQDSADTILANQTLIPQIKNAARNIIQCFQNMGKVLICGNGGSAADAQHLSAELLNRYYHERQELPGITLTADTSTITAIGNDYHFDEIFSKQVSALGNEKDIFLGITTSGNSENIIRAIAIAQQKGMQCIILNGKQGGKISALLRNDDINIIVNSTTTARIQEVHGLIIHCLCEIIDEHYIQNK